MKPVKKIVNKNNYSFGVIIDEDTYDTLATVHQNSVSIMSVDLQSLKEVYLMTLELHAELFSKEAPTALLNG